MSSGPARAIFPVVTGAEGAPAWIGATSRELRPHRFDGGVAEAPPSTPPKPAPRPIEDEAEVAAREILAARAELERARAAIEAEHAALVEARAQIAGLAEALVAAREEAARGAKDIVVDLAVGVAEAIVGRALDADPSAHVALVDAALAAVEESEDLELRVSPATWDALSQVLEGPAVMHRQASVPVVRDPDLGGYGCVVHVGRARVDARVAERLAAVREAWRHELRTEGGKE
ncbi:MAG: FliH/SctL family protein [Sandaracinaceae bacterium]